MRKAEFLSAVEEPRCQTAGTVQKASGCGLHLSHESATQALDEAFDIESF